jgi:hypothetical protein
MRLARAKINGASSRRRLESNLLDGNDDTGKVTNEVDPTNQQEQNMLPDEHEDSEMENPPMDEHCDVDSGAAAHRRPSASDEVDVWEDENGSGMDFEARPVS